MKTISHGKNKLTSRPQKRGVFFVFNSLLMSFKKSFKRLGQVQLEYLVLLSVLAAVVLLSLVATHRKISKNLNVKVFQKAVDQMKHTEDWIPND